MCVNHVNECGKYIATCRKYSVNLLKAMSRGMWSSSSWSIIWIRILFFFLSHSYGRYFHCGVRHCLLMKDLILAFRCHCPEWMLLPNLGVVSAMIYVIFQVLMTLTNILSHFWSLIYSPTPIYFLLKVKPLWLYQFIPLPYVMGKSIQVEFHKDLL